ncbi:MAG: HAD-IIIA family hydrolase [Phycisphaeraceae bacterium]
MNDDAAKRLADGARLAGLAGVRLIVFDVDGVLTDGSVIVDEQGVETRRFHIRDGLAFKLARSQGVEVAILSSRKSEAVTRRMGKLGVEHLVQGANDKRAGLERLLASAGMDGAHAAYVGDDLQDIPAMRLCAYPMAVADAAAEVRAAAVYVTTTPGGRGAAREAVEHVLRGQGKWDAAVRAMTGG